MSQLPKGWSSSTLSDCCDLVKDKADPLESLNETYIGLEHIESRTGLLLSKGLASETRSTKTRFANGDVLYGKLRPYLSKVYNPDFDGICSTDILALRPTTSVQNWLWYRMRCYDLTEYANKNSSGINLPRTSYKSLSRFPINLPPIPEQKRIVKKLDTCQGHIDRSKTALDAIPQLLEDYRASLLAKAFSGELTADWRAQQKAQGIQHEWVKKQLVNVINDGPRNGHSPKCSDNTKGSTVLKLSATTSGNLILNSKTTKTSIEPVDAKSHAWLEDGDVLVQRANSLELLGTTVIYNGPPRQYVYPDLMMRLRITNPSTRKYTTYFLNSYEARSYFRDNATGTAGNMPKINGKTLKATIIPLPSLAEQKEIVIRLESAFNRIEAIKLLHSKLSIQHSDLTQSLLAKAFRGELVPQDPNDEPASALLDRIKEQRHLEKQLHAKRPKKPRQATPKMSDPIPENIQQALEAKDSRLSASELFEKMGHANDANSEEVESFLIQLRDALAKGSVSRTRENNEDYFTLKTK